MATYDYSKLAATALRQFTKFGQTVTLRIYGEPVYDPATATATPVVTDYSRIGYEEPYTYQNSGEMLQNGTLAQASDTRLWLTSDAVAPSVSDHVILANGEEWVVANVKPYGQYPTDVLYDCRIRK